MSPMLAVWHSNFILLDLIAFIMFDEGYKLRSSSLCNFGSGLCHGKFYVSLFLKPGR